MNASEFFARLAAQPASKPALIGDRVTIHYETLVRETSAFAAHLQASGVRVLATLLDNGPAWVIADLAAMRAGVTHVPVPTFFTAQQTAHVLAVAGVDMLVAHSQVAGFQWTSTTLAGFATMIGTRAQPRNPAPAGTAKITFTSGTTAAPKGVCLSQQAMLAVGAGIAHATSGLSIERHLCSLPLAVLLENIAGIYAPLLAGAASVVLPTGTVGLEGSSRFDPSRLDMAVTGYAADSIIVLPQMLRAWTAWRRTRRGTGWVPRFIAVGGAAVGAKAIEDARAVGLAAHEGYGVSEGASVQALNLPDADRPGTVGRSLPHAHIRVAHDGEIEIAGTVMLGYLGESPFDQAWWPTGDIGDIDADGYLYVRGRKKNVLITAFGRNVSPEWIETLLLSQPAIAHAVVFGDGRPSLDAVVWPAMETISDDDVRHAVDAVNAELPDYARVLSFVRSRIPYAPESGVCTPNGRPLRPAIERLSAAGLLDQPR